MPRGFHSAPRRRARSGRAGLRPGLRLLLAFALTAASLGVLLDVQLRAAVALSAVAPLGASPGVPVQITGTGFDPVAGNNVVTLTMPGGATVSLSAETIAVVDAAKGIRRIGVTVPAVLPAGQASVVVANQTTGESAGGRTLQIVTLALPETASAARGAQQVQVRIIGSSNAQFVAGRTTVTFGAGVTVAAVQVQSATSLIATINVAATAAPGPRAINVVTSTQTMVVGGFSVTDPNRAPAFTSVPLTTGEESRLYAYQAAASDPDGDAVTFRVIGGPSGLTASAAGLVSWTPGPADVGVRDVVLEAADGRGATTRQSYSITVAAAPRLESIEMTPETFRFTAAGVTTPLTVTGRRSGGQSVPLTAASTGTTYESSNRFVATVSPDGTVTAAANGDAVITARNGALTDSSAISVEIGVTLDALQLTPASAVLRAAGATQPLTLRGTFSDGTSRDLTAAAGTTFTSSNEQAASVSPAGVVTASASGQTTITARHDNRQATAAIQVSISAGGGFLRGEVYDDSKGLPLGGAEVVLVGDGGGEPQAAVRVVADDRGRFVIPGRAGEAVVRILKAGYTTVERRGVIPANATATLLDARLTPLDSRSTPIGSALGGTAAASSGRATLRIAPGGLAGDALLRITPLGPQGLAGVLPAGWSPIAAAAIEPAGVSFSFPVALTLTHALAAAPPSPAIVVRYDTALHEWIAVGAVALDAGGLTFTQPIDRTGTFAVVVPDSAPFAPPAAIADQPLAGAAVPAAPVGLTATGEVVPRSAPPGDAARAVGRFGLAASGAVPSGTVVQVHVSERFDLLDATQVQTLPFVQDLVAYATPRPAGGGTAGAQFPITPSRSFTIQELLAGVIRLDVTAAEPDGGPSIVGAGGGTVTDPDGDALSVPPGALPSDAPIALRRIAAADAGIGLPSGLTAIAVLQIDAVGVTFGANVQLSLDAPAGIAADRVLVGRVFTDPFGQRRLRLIAAADLANGRLTTRASIGSIALEGIRGGGELVVVAATQPVAFARGTVARGGGAPVPSALVTVDSFGFADLTNAAGDYLVPIAVGTGATLRAIDPVSGDRASAIRQATAPGELIVTLLTLAVEGPIVVAVTPAAGAANVPLDSPVTIDFSEAVDPASVTESTASLQAAGTPVTVQRLLSADRRRLVLRPAAPLAGLTAYTVALGAIRDASGNPLSGYVPVVFTTLDPARPPQPAAGRIVAELPDESGVVLVTGAPGTAAAGAAVVVTNPRTQETATVIALADGSFRLRIAAIVGDELIVTLRGPDGREVTLGLTQFTGTDGATSIGPAGGTFAGGSATASVLPRALSRAGIFRLAEAADTGLPALPAGFSYAGAVAVEIGDARFRALATLTLTESQNRFAPVAAAAPPFSGSGTLTVPADALTNSALRFAAVAQDADGTRRTVAGTTEILGSPGDQAAVETSQATDFPSVFLRAPRTAIAGQQIAVEASAPAARVELSLPVPPGASPDDTFLLAIPVTLSGERRLRIVDRLLPVQSDDGTRLKTEGHELPGIAASGEYAMVTTHDALVFVTGIASGAEAIAAVDGLPFVFATQGANGRFVVPVRASQAFTIRFFDASGALRGTATGQAPPSGTVDVGTPLTPPTGRLIARLEPGERSIVDIGTPLRLHFSEPVDASTVNAALIVTDAAGTRIFGRTTISADGLTATFTPSRRWRFATQYRFGVGLSLLARSGARLATPVSSEFRTFEPSVVGTLALPDARDVAAAGATALVATSTGFAALDVTTPRAPALRGAVALPGGAGGVALFRDRTFADRNGTSHAGPLAIVASGSPAAGSYLKTFDLADVSAPALLGSTQIANASGQPAPPGVPAFVGTPRGIALGADDHGYAAIESVGVASVTLGAAIPLDPATPARGAGPRFPGGLVSESAHDVAQLGDRLLVAGSSGLTVLSAETMTRLGGVDTTGTARGVDGALAFRADLNGDGVVDAAERVDLAVVANGIDGAIHFYRVPVAGDPTLLSVVRIAGAETTGVRLSADERLAYVTLAGRGVALVDLDGPASVQPIDADRNGTDDRVLGVIDTPGSASRIALDLTRGLGYAADGPAGLAVLRLVPPRTRFTSVQRDPIAVVPGDEQTLAENDVVLATDDALRVSVEAAPGPGEGLVLAIAETGSPSRLAFADGGRALRLAEGLNTVAIGLTGSADTQPRDVTLSVQTDAGQTVATFAVRLLPAGAVADVEALYAAPRPVVIAPDASRAQLSVGARLFDGRIVNVTAGASGTRYASTNPAVATVDADGAVVAHAGGTAIVVITNGRTSVEATVHVQHPAAVVALSPKRRTLTFTSTGEIQTPDLTAQFSDGVVLSGSGQMPVALTSSNSAVVTVDGAGRLVAVGDGTATVTGSIGGVSTTFEVFVERRTPASVTAIELTAMTAPVAADDPPVLRARLIGTGSLEGLTVRAQLTGAAALTSTVVSSYGGRVTTALQGIAAGSYTAQLSVVDPATGATRSASTPLTVLAGGSEAEPNDTPQGASELATGRPTRGRLGAGDTRDVFRTTVKASGSVTTTVRLDRDVAAGSAFVLALDGNGAELARQPVVGRDARLTRPATAGAVFVALEVTGADVGYRAETSFIQDPLVVSSVAPTTGSPGTVVTIGGSGFSIDREEAVVLFGGVRAEVRTAAVDRLEAIVPANAVDGPLVVISGARRATAGTFVAGNTAPLPPVTFAPTTRVVRFDPINGADLNVTLLSVFFEPSMSRAAVAAVATAAGATIVGHDPALSSYELEFAANRSLSAIAERHAFLSAQPGVRRVVYDYAADTDLAIDARDLSSPSTAFAVSGIFDALSRIRSTPPWSTSRAAFQTVRVAMVDSGFDPMDPAEFQFDNRSIVTFYRANQDGVYAPAPFFEPSDKRGHGTAVASVIAAVNNETSVVPLSGVLNGLFEPTEAPFDLAVYGSEISSAPLRAAVSTVARAEQPYHVLNLSIRAQYTNVGAFEEARDAWRDTLRLLADRTLVVPGAGNDHTDAAMILPAMLNRDLGWVLTVGATAVNGYTRASFSNYADGYVGIAAVGEDVVVAEHRQEPPPARSWRRLDGTSFAAPQVTGVAALLVSLGGDLLTPDRLKQRLLGSARDIDATWDPGAMKHLNALAAILPLLPAPVTQPVYIANQARLGASEAGEIVALEIDPMTGRPPGGELVTDTSIPLTFTRGTATFVGRDPSALAIAPQGDYLYAVVSSADRTLGDGLVVVNTSNNAAEDFIALSGAPFPARSGVAPPPAVTVSTNRPGFVLSRDGRLAYIGAGTRLFIINTVERKLVRAFGDLPAEYRALAGTMLPGVLAQRLEEIPTTIFAGIDTPAGVERGTGISALALAPDGRTLFVAFQTGDGTGYQPGGVIALNVDLYADLEPSVPGLQSNLATYLQPAFPQHRVLKMDGAGEATGGDQPSALAVSPDSKYLYLLNGGMTFFTAIPAAELDPRKYTDLMGGPGFGAAASLGFTGGLSGVTATVNSFGNRSDALAEELRRSLGRRAAEGATFLAAPGYTGIFNVDRLDTQAGQQKWLFPADVGTGWNPPAANGGRIVNHLSFADVYTARPFAIAFRPDGGRALTAYFQTGNFGVLDLDNQQDFQQVAGANPAFASLAFGHAHAVYAATPAIALDSTVWPKRGAFVSFGGAFTVPSPDERLLFPWQIEYAQNGRFAVATHRGNRPAASIDARIPNFVGTSAEAVDQRRRLNELGFADDPADVMIGPDGTVYRPGDPITLRRGGGAISVIRDEAITTNLSRGLQTVTVDGAARPWFSTSPVCATNTPDPSGGVQPRCSVDVVDRFYEYRAPDIRAFNRPTGVAILPYVALSSPRFGDSVSETTPVVVSWRDPRIRHLYVTVEDLAGNDPPSQMVALTADDLAAKTAQAEFAALFGNVTVTNISPRTGHRYRIEIRALTNPDPFDPAAEVSRTSVDVTFAGSPSPARLTLSPTLGAVPIVAGNTLQLRASLVPAGAPATAPVDVTDSACYRWTSGATCGDAHVAEPRLDAVRSAIASRLSASAGAAVTFGEASISIAAGLVAVTTPGIQLISARSDAEESSASVVLAGFTIDRIALEPIVEAAVEAGTLGSRVLAAFGSGNNAPLVIAPRDSRFVDDDGQIVLDSVTLRYSGGGTISLNDLMAAIRPLIAEQFDSAIDGAFAPVDATPTWRNAQALVRLLDGPGTTGLSYTLDLTTTSTPTAFFSSFPFFRARISSNQSGLAVVTGKVALAGFGTGVDSILVWSLPPLESVTTDPASLTINLTSVPSPGPSVGAVGRLAPLSLTFAPPAEFSGAAAALEALLPSQLRGTFDRQFGGAFRFTASGAAAVAGGNLQLTDFRFAFDLPNLETDLFTTRWSSSDSSVAALGTREAFSQRIVHQGRAGTAAVEVRVTIEGLGTATGQLTVDVCNCPEPQSAANVVDRDRRVRWRDLFTTTTEWMPASRPGERASEVPR